MAEKRTLEDFADLIEKYGKKAVFSVAGEFGAHRAQLLMGGGAQGAAAMKTRGADMLDTVNFEMLSKELEVRYGENQHEEQKLRRLWQ